MSGWFRLCQVNSG